DRGGYAVAGDDVHREHALEVRVPGEERRGDVGRLRLVVVAVLRPEVLDVRVLLEFLLEALLALVGGADAGVDADAGHLARAADGLDQRVGRGSAAGEVVR